MSLPRRRRSARLLPLTLALVIAVIASGCGGDSGGSRSESVGTLGIPAGVGARERAAILDGVRHRVDRLGLRSRVTLTSAGVAIRPAPGPFVLEALARRNHTTLRSITGTGLGPCAPGAVSTLRPSHRCLVLGAPLTSTAAIDRARVTRLPIDGWGVDVDIDAAQYAAWRDAVTPSQGQVVAISSGDQAIADVTLSVIGLASQIGGQLHRDDARRIAAALLIDNDLPVALRAPRPPPSRGVSVDDVWMAQLAIRVCGEWIGVAPVMTTEEGLHSHGDGLIYVHSLASTDAGRPLTLGMFATTGDWTIAADRLKLWNRVAARNGDACGDRSDTRVRWAVDGIEQPGDPADLVLAPAQVIVIDFGPADGPVPTPPSLNDLLVTRWGPRQAG